MRGQGNSGVVQDLLLAPTGPLGIATSEGNEVAVCFNPSDLDRFLQGMDSPETAEAMDVDGIKRETVKVFVLDKEFVV
jgi:hypothetical protein